MVKVLVGLQCFLVFNLAFGVYEEKDIRVDDFTLNEFTKLPAFSTISTLCNTYKLTVLCILNNVEGDFVECGVAAGAQIVAMDHARRQFACARKIHLFDSFQGIPLAGPEDDSQPGIGAKPAAAIQAKTTEERLITSGIDIFSVEQVKANMVNHGVDLSTLVWHEGWFQNTVPVAVESIKNIALLRLDGDLYESTKVCLEFLYHKVVKGGYVIIDDYGLTGCRRAVQEYLDKNNLHPVISPVVDGGGPVYWQVN